MVIFRVPCARGEVWCALRQAERGRNLTLTHSSHCGVIVSLVCLAPGGAGPQPDPDSLFSLWCYSKFGVPCARRSGAAT